MKSFFLSLSQVLFLLCCLACGNEQNPSLVVQDFLSRLQAGKTSEALALVNPSDARLLIQADVLAKKIKGEYPEISHEIGAFEVLPLFYLNLKGKSFKTKVLNLSSTRAQVLTDIISEDNPKKKTSNLFNLTFDKDKRIWLIVLGINPEMLNSISSLIPVAIVRYFYAGIKRNDKKAVLSLVQDEDKGYIEDIFTQTPAIRPRQRPLQAALQQSSVLDELKKNEIGIKDTKTDKNGITVRIVYSDREFEEHLTEINGRWLLLPKKSELIIYLKAREGNTVNNTVQIDQDTDMEKKQ